MSWFGLKQQLKNYHKTTLYSDLTAGLIVSVVLLPQAMAYADLAGLPPASGLLAAILPMMIYALTGSSRSLSVGPVAIASLMTYTTIQSLPDTVPPALAAALLAGMVGALLLMLRLIKAGAVTHFISHSVISGFSSAAAVLIIASQARGLIGFNWSSHTWFEFSTATLGLLCLSTLFLFKTRWFRYRLNRLSMPSQLTEFITKLGAPVAITLSTTVAALAFSHTDIKRVGAVEFEWVTMNGFDLAELRLLMLDLLPSAALLALVGYMESVAVGRTLANWRRERLDPNQELWAVGAANIASAISMAMPVAGGFGRSMVNEQAGAQTQVAAITSALILLFMCTVATSAFALIPKAALSAIVIFAVIPLIDVQHLKNLARHNKQDATVWVITFFSVLIFKLEMGLVIGVVVSLSGFVMRSGKPHCAIVGRIPQTEQFRNTLRYKTEVLSDAIFIRIDESLFFANSQHVEDFINQAISQSPSARFLVLLGTGINGIDSDGMECLQRLERNLNIAGIKLQLAEFKNFVIDGTNKHDWFQTQKARGSLYLSAQDAFHQLLKRDMSIHISEPDPEYAKAPTEPE